MIDKEKIYYNILKDMDERDIEQIVKHMYEEDISLLKEISGL